MDKATWMVLREIHKTLQKMQYDIYKKPFHSKNDYILRIQRIEENMKSIDSLLQNVEIK